MSENKLKHYALIPAKQKSFRCPNKNWRKFYGKDCVVDFTLKTLPKDLFDKVIISTDKADYRCPGNAQKHIRVKSLASKKSTVIDLIKLIINEYKMSKKDYLWLLNPTSPFRKKSDFLSIAKIIDKERPKSLISLTNIHPFLWEGKKPLFKTTGKRRNTEDFKIEYGVENGMFYVMKIGDFVKNSSWYGKNVKLYRQDSIWASVDIDTESDFRHARNLAAAWGKDQEG